MKEYCTNLPTSVGRPARSSHFSWIQLCWIHRVASSLLEGNFNPDQGLKGILVTKWDIVQNKIIFLAVGLSHFFQKLSRDCASLPTLASWSILRLVLVGIQFRQFVELAGLENQRIIQFSRKLINFWPPLLRIFHTLFSFLDKICFNFWKIHLLIKFGWKFDLLFFLKIFLGFVHYL